ncbi:histidine kinase [Arthrobacter sp. H14-L1]|uniref:histidine kinase n=1 Tax=Arthrobacter sp. H14-L1 TaxID=2996697 RepID=UPI00226F41E9|nr:histidine kinase [Arthrobacter sp. H14-L1]MCY0904206.1 histidine kinase [Arthrobacter sp. H14-L1]
MQLDQYVAELKHHLAVAAESGGDEARAIAERLSAPLDSATRLVLLEALSAAAGEISRELSPGSVDVRLRGRDAEFVVSPAAEAAYLDPGAARGSASSDADGASTSRTTLRLPDALKVRVEDAAAADGLSVNSWLVRAIAAALEPAIRRSTQRGSGSGDHYAGWVR